jgi:NAD(P)-dependent dehydrogenase (short-subunit alcohol dehydrogenase family)
MTTKNILIIGASRGIGAELVKNLAQNEQHQIWAFSRNLKTMEENFSALRNVKSFALDLNAADVKNTFSSQIEEISSIDILIYNAGFLVNKPFIELTREEIQTSYQINVLSAFEIFQAAMPKFSEKAHIVSISSMGGFQGTMKFGGLSSYSTPKAALVSLTELLAEEFKDTQWAFNCLALGAAQTEMLEAAFPGYQAPVSAADMAEFIADFSLNADRFIRGKVVPVSLSTP